MLRLPPFEYLHPKTLTEAFVLKEQYGPNAVFTAGGTDLYPNMKRRQLEPRALIALRGIDELHRLEYSGGMTLGAGVSLLRIEKDPVIRMRYPALSQAAGLVSSPQLRAMATIGGNLCVDTRCTYYNQNYPWRKALGFCMKKDGDICWVARSSPKCLAVSSSDCAPVMLALDAKYHLHGPEGKRVVYAADFYRNDGISYLDKSPDELLVSIELPVRDGWRTTYRKLRRRGTIDFPVIGVAAAVSMDSDGICAEAKLALGAVATAPLMAREAANLLVGNKVGQELIETVARESAKLAKPMDNTDMSLGYRKKMVSVFVARALEEVCEI